MRSSTSAGGYPELNLQTCGIQPNNSLKAVVLWDFNPKRPNKLSSCSLLGRHYLIRIFLEIALTSAKPYLVNFLE